MMLEGEFFLRKKPLSSMASVYTNSEMLYFARSKVSEAELMQ
jgi:hypothetical protein